MVAGSCRQPQTYVKPEAAITVFELLMKSCVSLETCWAIKKHWNNKFYYTVASCWLFLYDLYTWHIVRKVFPIENSSVLSNVVAPKYNKSPHSPASSTLGRTTRIWCRRMCYVELYPLSFGTPLKPNCALPLLFGLQNDSFSNKLSMIITENLRSRKIRNSRKGKKHKPVTVR